MPDATAAFQSRLLRSDNSLCGLLGSYVLRRGTEQALRVQDKNSASRWTLGLSRTHVLCSGRAANFAGVEEGSIPPEFPLDKLAKMILESVALFSELSLRIAHTIALLYNVYRRGTFDEVILSGGVLGGETGPLIKWQVEAFLRKYYDKIYGRGRSLPEDAIQLAGLDDPSIAGPMGAAQAANRRHKMECLRLMCRSVDLLVSRLRSGEEITIETVAKENANRVLATEIRKCLDTKVAGAMLAPKPGLGGAYLKMTDPGGAE